MTEIQGKSILVRVSARFELARARVIGSQLYTIVMSAQKTTNTPTLNGGNRGGVRILLFSEVTLLEYVSTILSPTVR